jgi:ectoine hydroxylase-related dioxygenase (phytanoyl-CoA dioxygenase family)
MTQMIPHAQAGALTDIERFMFESVGYIIIEDVLNPDEVVETLEASQRLHAKHNDGWKQIGKGFETEPALERLIDHPAILPKVRALYGDQFVLQSAWCTVQRAGSQSVGWHQDGSGVYEFARLGYPLPLLQLRASYSFTDQSQPFMGNMMMIPGSHRSPIPLP